jgi:hypothetical protein
MMFTNSLPGEARVPASPNQGAPYQLAPSTRASILTTALSMHYTTNTGCQMVCGGRWQKGRRKSPNYRSYLYCGARKNLIICNIV